MKTSKEIRGGHLTTEQTNNGMLPRYKIPGGGAEGMGAGAGAGAGVCVDSNGKLTVGHATRAGEDALSQPRACKGIEREGASFATSGYCLRPNAVSNCMVRRLNNPTDGTPAARESPVPKPPHSVMRLFRLRICPPAVVAECRRNEADGPVCS